MNMVKRLILMVKIKLPGKGWNYGRNVSAFPARMRPPAAPVNQHGWKGQAAYPPTGSAKVPVPSPAPGAIRYG